MSEIQKIPIDRIILTGDNPRREFDEERLKELGESIKTHGLLQPIIVRPKNGNYELIIGERRLRASKLVGLMEIDAKVVTLEDSIAMELRLIENTQRTDLTDPEKGDAVLALLEHFPEKYASLSGVAKAIRTPVSTVWLWVNKSAKLSEHIRFLIGNKQLGEKTALYLLKYEHSTQNKLADIIANYPLTETKAIEFLKIYDKRPNAELSELANEANGVKKVTVNISSLSSKTRREIESVIEERKEATIAIRRKSMQKAIQKAHEVPRQPAKKIWKSTHETLGPKVAKLTETLSALEPQERQEITEAIGKRLDNITQSVDKENVEWMKKWEMEVAPKIKQETPENYARKLEETIHGIWQQIFVEYPDSVKEVGQKQVVSPLSGDRLERLRNTLNTTIRELDAFRNVVASELLVRSHKKA